MLWLICILFFLDSFFPFKISCSFQLLISWIYIVLCSICYNADRWDLLSKYAERFVKAGVKLHRAAFDIWMDFAAKVGKQFDSSYWSQLNMTADLNLKPALEVHCHCNCSQISYGWTEHLSLLVSSGMGLDQGQLPTYLTCMMKSRRDCDVVNFIYEIVVFFCLVVKS